MVSLGLFNLLLVSAGLLLTYFDWKAARRRELLYLYSEDKAGVEYFEMARRRRAQYLRLVVAFSVLFLAEFLTTNLLFSNRDATKLGVWINCWHLLGLALLGVGFLFNPESRHKGRADACFVAFLVFWAIYVLLLLLGVTRRWEPFTTHALHDVRGALVLTFVLTTWVRRSAELPAGLLRATPNALMAAFAVWLITPLVASSMSAPDLLLTSQAASFLSYAILVGTVVRNSLNEFEYIEGSRHRLGRERQVILSFLQRIGSAFTTALDPDQVLKIILESALETTEASAGAIYLYHAETGELTPRIVLNFFPPLHIETPTSDSEQSSEELGAEMSAQSFALGEGVIGQVAKEGRARLIHDVRAENIMLGRTTDFMRNRSMLLVPLKVRDEPLGVMAVLNKQRGSFSIEDQFLLQSLADQGALSISNAILTMEVGKQERIRRELQIARDIQKMLLPDKCPVVEGFDIAALGSSATEVGGDYYDFFWVDEDRLGIVVADVSGKGVPAALTVAMMRSVFRTQATGNSDVRDVLSRVNSFMTGDMRRDMFITCIYGILEISTRKFSWSRAGHEPLLVAHDSGEVDVLSPDGFALGVIDSPDFDQLLEVETIELHSGDRVLLFTDGLTEAMNTEGEEFGMERILGILKHDDPIFAEVEHGTQQHQNGHNGNATAAVPAAEKEANSKNGALKTQGLLIAPDAAMDQTNDLQWMEMAIKSHVGGAPQSDDLTIVYLSAK